MIKSNVPFQSDHVQGLPHIWSLGGWSGTALLPWKRIRVYISIHYELKCRETCIKLVVWIQNQPAADYMTVNLRSMKIQSQGAVFTPVLLFQLHWMLPCQNITTEQTLTGVKNCNNNNGGRLPANCGVLTIFLCRNNLILPVALSK